MTRSPFTRGPLPRASKAAEESFESNTVIADETVVLPGTKNHEGDDNIVAPYLKPTAGSEIEGFSKAPVSVFRAAPSSTALTTPTLPLVLPPRDGGVLKSRFRKALLGEEADLD